MWVWGYIGGKRIGEYIKTDSSLSQCCLTKIKEDISRVQQAFSAKIQHLETVFGHAFQWTFLVGFIWFFTLSKKIINPWG